jgi:hypothetical protein
MTLLDLFDLIYHVSASNAPPLCVEQDPSRNEHICRDEDDETLDNTTPRRGPFRVDEGEHVGRRDLPLVGEDVEVKFAMLFV